MTDKNTAIMTGEYEYKMQGEGLTAFSAANDSITLNSLFGLSCGIDGKDNGPAQAKELACLGTDKVKSDRNGFALEVSTLEKDKLSIVWSLKDTGLKLVSNWQFCNETGIWSRRDKLVNTGAQEVIITRCLARFVLSPGSYEVYSQSSSWCRENKGGWQPLQYGSLALGCEGGRTSQGSTPYLCIRDTNLQAGIVFHVVPVGNWVIKVNTRTGPGASLPFAVVELGLSDDNLGLRLKPAESVALPEILIQELIQGDIQNTATRLHRYLFKHKFKISEKLVPLVYNTWLDLFESIDMERLKKQLSAARELGCEVFTVDAGWFGAGTGNWFEQSGDWREKQEDAFHGKLLDFAEAVRAEGLGFGLWMEPERIGSDVPVRLEHKDWFIQGENSCYYPDITQPVVYKYLLEEISRVIDTYDVVWLKQDFNFNLGIDPYGSELMKYYEASYKMKDELKAKYPDVFFEGCAGGGMRLDIQSQLCCDAHFISDNACPSDVLHIYQGGILRLLPGRITKWAVMRPAGRIAPEYLKTTVGFKERIIAANGATWESATTVDPGYLMLSAMPGVMGLSGDIAGLTEEIAGVIKGHVDFYKAHRVLLYNSIGYQLTPVWGSEADRRWIAVQLQDYRCTDSLLFVYRLDDSACSIRIKPEGLSENRQYRVEYWNCDRAGCEMQGQKLMGDGIKIEIPVKFGAIAIVIKEM